MVKFWEIIKDDKLNSFEILGASSDDTALTNLTCEMQKAGMQVGARLYRAHRQPFLLVQLALRRRRA